MKMKFSDMHYGQWFKEVRNKNARIFIKLQNILPSGTPVIYNSYAAEDYLNTKKGEKLNSYPFNSVDIDGIPACCPDWLEFEIIESPFPQRVKHHAI